MRGTRQVLPVAGCLAALVLVAPPVVAGPAGADVAATISGPTGTMPPGATVTYDITVTNRGPEEAPGTVGFLAVDGRARLDSAGTSVGSCAPAEGKIKGFSCVFGTLAPGADPVLVTARVTLPPKPGTVVASVQVASAAPGLDPDGADNFAEAWTSVG